MRYLKVIFLFLILTFWACYSSESKILQEPVSEDQDKLKERISHAKQILLSLSDSLSSKSGELYLVEKKDNNWVVPKTAFKVNYGANGLAWGIGLHKHHEGLQKKEGDKRSPAGIFELGRAFGYSPKPKTCKFDYLQIDETTQCIEDVKSKWYNKIVKNETAVKDWSSTDHMLRNDDLFKYGLFVKHNPEQIVGKGSCIFFHLWRDEHNQTAGCTALEEKNMFDVLNWIDTESYPILVQVPKKDYFDSVKQYNLPLIK